MLDLRDVLPQVKTAVNIIISKDDAFLPLAAAEYMTSKLTDSELLQVDYEDVMENLEMLVPSIMRVIP